MPRSGGNIRRCSPVFWLNHRNAGNHLRRQFGIRGPSLFRSRPDLSVAPFRGTPGHQDGSGPEPDKRPDPPAHPARSAHTSSPEGRLKAGRRKHAETNSGIRFLTCSCGHHSSMEFVYRISTRAQRPLSPPAMKIPTLNSNSASSLRFPSHAPESRRSGPSALHVSWTSGP